MVGWGEERKLAATAPISALGWIADSPLSSKLCRMATEIATDRFGDVHVWMSASASNVLITGTKAL